MAINDRLKRLEGGEPPPCGTCPYARAPLWLEATRCVDEHGNEVGYEPDPDDPGPPWTCDECPYEELPEGRRPVLAIEVVSTREVEG
jgi:hypothetical protein